MPKRGGGLPGHLLPHLWKKGQSGNPEGGRRRKPKPLTILDHVYRLLEEEHAESGEEFARLCAKGIVLGIAKGSAPMARLVMEYQSGSPEHARVAGDGMREMMREIHDRWMKREDEQTEDAEFEELGDGDETTP